MGFYSQVKVEYGLEMLSILKKHDSDVSILDDFDFYEDRQKSMQERKARQQRQQPSSSDAVDWRLTPGSRSSELISQISKSFGQVVKLEKANGEGLISDNNDTTAVNSEDPRKPPSSSAA